MSFIARFRQIHAEIERRGIEAFDMRDEGHLEHVFAGGTGAEINAQSPRETGRIEWLEENSELPRSILEPNQIRYFLDGSQRTLRAFYCDNLPVVAGIVGAAVLRRDGEGRLHVERGMVGFKQVWVIPRRTKSHDLNRVIAILEEQGEDVVDPIQDFPPERYAAELRDFGGMIEYAFKRVGAERAELETALLLRWNDEIGAHDGLMLVDGPLREPVSGAIGLVKSFTRQYVSGAEAMTLFRLRQTQRTAAFRVTDAWRSSTPIKAWYQRQWDASGRDPRHALIRLELFDGWADHPSFEEIAAWIIRERVPTAKADARWATLLYPVHQLEEILKNQMDTLTRGWTARV